MSPLYRSARDASARGPRTSSRMLLTLSLCGAAVLVLSPRPGAASEPGASPVVVVGGTVAGADEHDPLPLRPPVGAQTVSWEALPTLSAQAPAVAATAAAAEASALAAQALTVRGRRPSFGAQLEHLQRLAAREAQTPFGVQEVDPRTAWQAGARVDVPVLRWSDQALRPQSGQAEARAAALQREATTQGVLAQARDLWLEQLRVHAQAAALWEQRRALQQLERQLAQMVAAERTVPAEQARVRLAIDEIDIELRALEQALSALAWGLAGTVGDSAPLFAPEVLPDVPAASGVEAGTPLGAQVAMAQAQGAQLAARASRWDDLPTVTLQAGWEWTDLETLVDHHSVYGAVVLQWQPDLSGGRRLGAQAQDAQADAALAQARAQTQQAAAAQAAARALAQEADDRLGVLARSRQDAEAVVAVAQARYDAGAVTLVEVLDAMATLARIQAAASLAEIQRVQAWADAAAVAQSVR